MLKNVRKTINNFAGGISPVLSRKLTLKDLVLAATATGMLSPQIGSAAEIADQMFFSNNQPKAVYVAQNTAAAEPEKSYALQVADQLNQAINSGIVLPGVASSAVTENPQCRVDMLFGDVQTPQNQKKIYANQWVDAFTSIYGDEVNQETLAGFKDVMANHYNSPANNPVYGNHQPVDETQIKAKPEDGSRPKDFVYPQYVGRPTDKSRTRGLGRQLASNEWHLDLLGNTHTCFSDEDLATMDLNFLRNRNSTGYSATCKGNPAGECMSGFNSETGEVQCVPCNGPSNTTNNNTTNNGKDSDGKGNGNNPDVVKPGVYGQGVASVDLRKWSADVTGVDANGNEIVKTQNSNLSRVGFDGSLGYRWNNGWGVEVPISYIGLVGDQTGSEARYGVGVSKAGANGSGRLAVLFGSNTAKTTDEGTEIKRETNNLIGARLDAITRDLSAGPGRSYVRFMAQDVAGNSTVTVTPDGFKPIRSSGPFNRLDAGLDVTLLFPNGFGGMLGVDYRDIQAKEGDSNAVTLNGGLVYSKGQWTLVVGGGYTIDNPKDDQIKKSSEANVHIGVGFNSDGKPAYK